MPPVLANAPDPNPTKPKFTPPPGAADTHIHLFGPQAKYPINPGAKYTPREILPEHSIALQDALGLSFAVVVSGGAYARDYRFMADSLEKYPNRFRGIALMPDDATPADFERLTRLGVRGLRFMSRAHGMIVPAINAGVAARAKEHGWHVQFYPHATDIVEHADQLLALDNTIVLDHFASVPAEGGTGQEAFRTVLRMLDTGRVWVKLSGPMRCSRQEYPYANVTPLARALVKHAPERLVWATDWPHVNMNDRQMPNDGALLDLMLDWVPDEAARSRILADNPRALYGFPKAS
jgi:predicted TIM-barrel fold metal-dependent hydrolase